MANHKQYFDCPLCGGKINVQLTIMKSVSDETEDEIEYEYSLSIGKIEPPPLKSDYDHFMPCSVESNNKSDQDISFSSSLYNYNEDYDEDEVEDESEYDEDEYYHEMEVREEISEYLDDFSSSLASSFKEGWFYDDENDNDDYNG
jgi:hypothetical protein